MLSPLAELDACDADTAALGWHSIDAWARLIARLARDSGALVLAIVTQPFDFEGSLRLMAVAWTDSAVGTASTDSILRDPVFARVLVFTRTKHGADRVVRRGRHDADQRQVACRDSERAQDRPRHG